MPLQKSDECNFDSAVAQGYSYLLHKSENLHALRLTSELVDLRVANANLIRYTFGVRSYARRASAAANAKRAALGYSRCARRFPRPSSGECLAARAALRPSGGECEPNLCTRSAQRTRRESASAAANRKSTKPTGMVLFLLSEGYKKDIFALLC